MGRFKLGSTIVALFAPGAVSWDPALACGKAVRMGARLACFRRR
jgi:phosphatidylserine decarboxylase